MANIVRAALLVITFICGYYVGGGCDQPYQAGGVKDTFTLGD